MTIARTGERDALRRALVAAGIETAIPCPIPVNRQPGLASGLGRASALPATEAEVREVVTLPASSTKLDTEVAYVIDSVRHYFDAD